MPTVRVFRNLTVGPKGKVPVYSIQARTLHGRWITVAHAKHVCLSGVLFRVSKAGVERIRRTRKKAVVATVQGTLEHWSGTFRPAAGALFAKLFEHHRCEDADFPDPEHEKQFLRAQFNPYWTDTFVDDEKRPLARASTAWIGGPGILATRSA